MKRRKKWKPALKTKGDFEALAEVAPQRLPYRDDEPEDDLPVIPLDPDEAADAIAPQDDP